MEKKSEVIIRNAREEDINKIYSLGKQTKELRFSKKLGFHDKKEIKEYVKNKNGNVLLVAVYEREFAGFLFAKIVDSDWCMLDNIVVEKKFREKGVGTEFINYLIKLLKNKKIGYVQSLVEEDNKRLRRFWEDEGLDAGKKFIWYDKILRK